MIDSKSSSIGIPESDALAFAGSLVLDSNPESVVEIVAASESGGRFCGVLV